MEKTVCEKYTAGFGLALFAASILNALICLVKDTNPSVFAWMKAATAHHWKTHGVIVILVFVALGFILSRLGLEEKLKLDAGKISTLALLGVASSVSITVIFYAAFYQP